MVVAWFIWKNVGEFTAVADALAHARFRWLVVASAAIGVYFCTWAWLYVVCMRTVGITLTWRQSLPTTLSALFVNTIAPTGSTAGSTLFVSRTRTSGQPAAVTVMGYLLALLAELLSLVVLVGVSLVLIRHNEGQLYSAVLISGLLLLALVVVMTLLLILARHNPERMEWWLHRLGWLINTPSRVLRRPQPLSKKWAVSTSAQLHDAAIQIFTHPQDLGQIFGITLVMHGATMTAFAAVFLAMQQPLTWATVLTAYALMMLFWIVSPTPQGIGVVEVVGAYVLSQTGMNTGIAVVVALAFRGVAYWIPLVIGGFVFVHTNRLQQIDVVAGA